MDSDYDRNKDGSLTLKDDIRIKELSDLPVLAFIKIIIGINMSNKLEKYKNNIGLNERLPGYCVKMGFGLHIGWAIEVIHNFIILLGSYWFKFQN